MSTLVSHAECQVNYLLDTEPNFTRYLFIHMECEGGEGEWEGRGRKGRGGERINNRSRGILLCFHTSYTHTCSLQGVSIVWEARLGYALIGLTACDMECLTLPLDERRWSVTAGMKCLQKYSAIDLWFCVSWHLGMTANWKVADWKMGGKREGTMWMEPLPTLSWLQHSPQVPLS